MSEPTKAVFLSYASQDAEAARKICDALRSGGVEVWFDADGGLEHGDEWDAKIRRQIKECVLFIPVISANTQAREEGYFRIEWDLAAERARGIASGVPFILPVVIDDTREPDALVPDRFRAVQWTRLRGGEVPPDVRARFLKLWSHRTGVLKNEELEAGRPRPAQRDEGVAAPTQAKVGRPLRGRLGWIVGATVAVVLLGVFAQKFLLREKISIQSPEAARRSAPPTTPLSEARQLAEKAHALFEALDSIRDDFLLAEDLLKQALAKDGADAEVWACYAQLHSRFVVRGWDVTNARKEGAQVAAQRALRLDPQSFEARFAQAGLAGDTPSGLADGERAWRELRRERPTDRRVLVSLGIVLRKLNRQDEANALYNESAALPGGDPLALYDKSLDAWFLGRTAEAEATMRAAIAQKPFSGALLMSAWYAMILHGDLDGALVALNRVSPATLREDRGCYFAYLLHYYRRETDAALARLRELPRDWLDDNWYRGPKGKLAGEVLQRAGRTEAAAIEWRAALKLVETRLAAAPTNGSLLYNRTYLLANLGERDEAARQFAVLLQMAGINLADDKPVPTPFTRICVLLGRHAEAIQQIRRGLKVERHAVDYTAATLRLDGDWDPLRSEPEFAKVIAEAEAMEKAAALPSSGGGGVAMAPAPDLKSVAVLAFANLSDDKGNEYFSDGISEELLTVLQKIPGLHVAARTSAFSFKGSKATAQEIGEKLGVAHLVEGSVQKIGNRVKISARLSRAATGEQLWSKKIPPRELTDAFAAETEIALAIVDELRGRLAGAGAAPPEVPAQLPASEIGGTKHGEARQLYLQGKFFSNQLNAESLHRAVELLQRAVQLDPAFAQGWAALAHTAVVTFNYATTLGEFDAANTLAHQASARAIALEPGLAAAQLARFEVQISDFDWRGAAESLRRATALAPGDAAVVASAANLAYYFGQVQQAITLGQQAVALDPVNPAIRVTYGGALAAGRRFGEAAAECRKIVELSPTMPWGHAGVSENLTLQGRFDQAATEAELENPGWTRLYAMALAQWGQKKKPEAGAALALLIKDYADVAAVQIALVYAFCGENDPAFEWLERADRQRDSGLTASKCHPLFENLRADARWPNFLKKLGLSDEQLK